MAPSPTQGSAPTEHSFQSPPITAPTRAGWAAVFLQDGSVSDGVEPITALPLGKVLGEEFKPTEDQAWLAKWAERWMDLDSSAARGWHSNGTDLVGEALLWETTSDWLEIDVELRRGPRGILRDPYAPDPVWTLKVFLMVACWCEDNHNAHYIEERRWDVAP